MRYPSHDYYFMWQGWLEDREIIWVSLIYLFSQKEQELEKSEAWGEFDTLLSTWSWKGPYAEKLQWPLGADGDPQLTQVRKQGTWSYNSNEMCSANNLNELPDKSPAWVTPWFWHWETLSWGPSWTKPDIWPTEPWTKKLPLLSATTFGVNCYGSNRTRMHRTKAMHLERLVASCIPGPQHHLVPSFLPSHSSLGSMSNTNVFQYNSLLLLTSGDLVFFLSSFF